MSLHLRLPAPDDWSAILQLAFGAVPWDAEGNPEWVNNRKNFSGLRRHFVVEDDTDSTPIGYGSIEESPETGIFRMFVVMSGENLNGLAGDMIYDRLFEELLALNAHGIWAREYASDTAIQNFFAKKGFVKEKRLTLPGYAEMVVMSRSLKRPSNEKG